MPQIKYNITITCSGVQCGHIGLISIIALSPLGLPSNVTLSHVNFPKKKKVRSPFFSFLAYWVYYTMHSDTYQ